MTERSEQLLRRLFETAPDPTGFDATAPGYREAWQEVEQHLQGERLCTRKLCMHRPGESVEGMVCHYVYKGSIPCTGVRRCMFCGEPEPESTPIR